MQLIYLHFTSLKEDQEAYQSTLSQVELMLKNKNLSPESAFADSVPTTLYKGNPRFLALDTMDVKNASQSRIYQMARERFANANGFVFYFVGNFDEATIRPLIEQYIASLPSQKKVESWKVVPFFATGHVENKFTRKMMSPKAMALDLWHMPSTYTLENSILADAAGQILSMVYLKDIREDASAAYSVFAQGSLKRQGDNAHVVMQAVCPMDPAKAQTALDLLAKGIADNTVKVDADKVAKVKENMLKNADADAKKNNHWVDVIDEYVWTGVDM
jgi:zinc protease